MLTGQELEAVNAALSDAFTTEDDLNRLLLFARNLTVDQVSLAKDLGGVISDLVSRAEREGWLLQLLSAAAAQRPENQALQGVVLQGVVRKLKTRAALEPEDPFDARRLTGRQVMADRRELRAALKRLAAGTSSVLVVDGRSMSGKSHTVSLISHAAQRRSLALAWVDLEKLVRGGETKPIKASVVGRSIVGQLGLTGMPEPNEEQETRWVSDFSDWLTGALKADLATPWVVLDGFRRVPVSAGTELLISELSSRAYVNLRLRLVLLAYAKREDLETSVHGMVEFEEIQPIPRPDLEQGLLSFFMAEYVERAAEQGEATRAGLEQRIAGSVQRVLEQVRDDDPIRLIKLRRAVQLELSRSEDEHLDQLAGSAQSQG